MPPLNEAVPMNVLLSECPDQAVKNPAIQMFVNLQ